LAILRSGNKVAPFGTYKGRIKSRLSKTKNDWIRYLGAVMLRTSRTQASSSEGSKVCCDIVTPTCKVEICSEFIHFHN